MSENQNNIENKTPDIAKTIIEQIRYADRSALMAWGATEFIALPESMEYQGGLQFKVNGLTFKGYVNVELRWVDDYRISFVNEHKEEVHAVEIAYCDMLVNVIDWVEGK